MSNFPKINSNWEKKYNEEKKKKLNGENRIEKISNNNNFNNKLIKNVCNNIVNNNLNNNNNTEILRQEFVNNNINTLREDLNSIIIGNQDEMQEIDEELDVTLDKQMKIIIKTMFSLMKTLVSKTGCHALFLIIASKINEETQEEINKFICVITTSRFHRILMKKINILQKLLINEEVSKNDVQNFGCIESVEGEYLNNYIERHMFYDEQSIKIDNVINKMKLNNCLYCTRKWNIIQNALLFLKI